MEGIIAKASAAEALSKGRGAIRSDKQQREVTEERLKKACADFESIFISYMFKTMRRTIPASSPNNIPGQDIYTMLVDQKVAEDLAKRAGGMGIQEMLLFQLGGSRQTGKKE